MIRLRALRMANVGRFSAPIALEGLGDGLNVLSGPNELGKSTLLRALEVVLTTRYGLDNELLRNLIPNGGGTPVIEAEFEAEGHLWRIHKQYLNGATAVLQDLTAGTELKKAGAETRLAALIEGPADLKNRFGMLWVKQDDGLKPVAPETMGGGLSALIMSEVDAVALDAPARLVHKTIQDALKTLQQPKNRMPKANGAWANAVTSNDEAVKRLATAEARASEQAARLDKLAAHTTERRALLTPQAVAMRSEALDAARLRYAKAVEAHQQRREAGQSLSKALTALQSAEHAEKSLRAAIDEYAKLKSQSTVDQALLEDLAKRRDDCAAGLAATRAHSERDTAAGAALEASLEAARQAARASEAAIERDRLAERIGDVRQALAAADRARAEAAALASTTEPRVKALGAAIARLAELDAALAAVVPEVAITLEPGGGGRIVVNGQPLAHGITLNPHAPLTLEIAGIGRIVIAPNPATVSGTRRDARERTRAEIETAFATLGVATFSDAETRLSAKLAADASARDAAIVLQALAPNGIDALIAAHADLSARAALATGNFDSASIDALQGKLTAHRIAGNAAAAEVQRKQTAHTELREQAARLETATASRAERIATLEHNFGDSAAQHSAHVAAATKLDTARTHFSDAKSAADAWAANPDADRVDAIATEMRTAEAAVATVEARRVALDQAIFGVESELRVACDEDIESELETARAAAQVATARLADVDAEVKALNLLDRELRSLGDAGRREWSGPILQRIKPYLIRVFPDAALELDEKLIPAQLLRDGRKEAHDQLSRGTQEQIAILVRLGLARLLADRGHAVPLILDDALVYADDWRIAQMFKALEDAARLHQVIVLNCREQTFAALAHAPGAKALAFETWVPSALAA